MGKSKKARGRRQLLNLFNAIGLCDVTKVKACYEELIAKGGNINQTTSFQGESHASALLAATVAYLNKGKQNQIKEIVKFLLAKGADPLAQIPSGPRRGLTPFHQALLLGQVELLMTMLIFGKLNGTVTESALNLLYSIPTNNRKRDPELIINDILELYNKTKLKKELKAVILWLLGNGVDVNQPGKMGMTPLHLTAMMGLTDITVMLTSRKADLNAKESGGDRTPCMIAVANNNLETLKTLLKAGADPDCQAKDGATALFIAAQEGYIEYVRILLEYNANVDLAHESGNKPLDVASLSENNAEVINLLKQYQQPQRLSLMRQACVDGELGVLKTLVKESETFDPDVVVEYRQEKTTIRATLVAFAVANNRIEIVKYLVEECNADVNVGGSECACPLYCAYDNKHTEMVSYLIANGAKDSDHSGRGKSVLAKALFDKDHKCIIALEPFITIDFSHYADKQTQLIIGAIGKLQKSKDKKTIEVLVNQMHLFDDPENKLKNLQTLLTLYPWNIVRIALKGKPDLRMLFKTPDSFSEWFMTLDISAEVIINLLDGNYIEQEVVRTFYLNENFMLTMKNLESQLRVDDIPEQQRQEYLQTHFARNECLARLQTYFKNRDEALDKKPSAPTGQHLLSSESISKATSSWAYLQQAGFSKEDIKKLMEPSSENFIEISETSNTAASKTVTWFDSKLSSEQAGITVLDNNSKYYYWHDTLSQFESDIDTVRLNAFRRLRAVFVAAKGQQGIKHIAPGRDATLSIGDDQYNAKISLMLKVMTFKDRILCATVASDDDSSYKLIIPCLYLANGLHTEADKNSLSEICSSGIDLSQLFETSSSDVSADDEKYENISQAAIKR